MTEREPWRVELDQERSRRRAVVTITQLAALILFVVFLTVCAVAPAVVKIVWHAVP